MFWIILRLGLDWRAFWFLGEGGMEECLAGNVWAGHLPLLFSMTYGTQTWQRGGLLRGAGGGIRQTEETEETFWHSTANAHAAFPIFSLVKTLWFVSFLTHGCAVVASGWLFLNIRFSRVSFAPRIFNHIYHFSETQNKLRPLTACLLPAALRCAGRCAACRCAAVSTLLHTPDLGRLVTTPGTSWWYTGSPTMCGSQGLGSLSILAAHIANPEGRREVSCVFTIKQINAAPTCLQV